MKFLHYFSHFPAWLVIHTWAFVYFGGTSSLSFWLVSGGSFLALSMAKDYTLEKIGDW